jgi:hypothetical protein
VAGGFYIEWVVLAVGFAAAIGYGAVGGVVGFVCAAVVIIRVMGEGVRDGTQKNQEAHQQKTASRGRIPEA